MAHRRGRVSRLLALAHHQKRTVFNELERDVPTGGVVATGQEWRVRQFHVPPARQEIEIRKCWVVPRSVAHDFTLSFRDPWRRIGVGAWDARAR
jgi:hypothetical protein